MGLADLDKLSVNKLPDFLEQEGTPFLDCPMPCLDSEKPEIVDFCGKGKNPWWQQNLEVALPPSRGGTESSFWRESPSLRNQSCAISVKVYFS